MLKLVDDHGTKELLLELLKEVKLLRKDAVHKGAVLDNVLESVETVKVGVSKSSETITSIQNDTTTLKTILRKSHRGMWCKLSVFAGICCLLFVYYKIIWNML